MADEDQPENAASPLGDDASPNGEKTAGAAAPETGELAAESPPQQPAETSPEAPTASEEPAAQPAPAAQESAASGEPAADPAPAAEEPATPPATAEPVAQQEVEDEDETEPAPREKPAVPGAHLEVDIVPEGVDPLAPEQQSYEHAYAVDPYAIEEETEEAQEGEEETEEVLAQPISTAAIDLAADARYRATGKRKSAIARVTLRPGNGTYEVNGRALEEHFPRLTLQRNIRQPLETVGYQDRMDVVARLHGGGISAQAGALRHGVSRALLEADPNLRGELKRRGFLTRDSRAKERKKAGLKKARKRPQFSKR
jgi:small subunit ribosomal protein S9